MRLTVVLLPFVPVTHSHAAAEVAVQLARAGPCDRRQCAQSLVERIRGVGVVHEDQGQHGLRVVEPARHLLHAAGHGRQRAASFTRSGQWHPQSPQAGQNTQQVGSVVGADQWHAQVHALTAFGNREMHPRSRDAAFGGMKACAGIREGHGPNVQPCCQRQFVGQGLPFGIVHIDHSSREARPRKQGAFGGPVGIHADVIVQVVLGEIGEHSHLHGGAGQPMLDDADG